MKTITIRELRHNWPEAEAALKIEGEILITRNSVPVAKLVPVPVEAKKRPRWDKEEHARWQKKINRGVVHKSSDWAKIRADRELF